VGGPDSGMDRFVRAGLVPYLTIRSVVANMRRLAARVVTKKKARPAVVMHSLGRPCGRVTWRTRINLFSNTILWLVGAACTASNPSGNPGLACPPK
jgi:hypothetical protein